MVIFYVSFMDFQASRLKNILTISGKSAKRKEMVSWNYGTFKLMGLNAGATMCLWRTHSLPSTMTKPLPNMGSLSVLNTLGFPHRFAITNVDIFFKNSGSATYRNGSVPNQYTKTLPAQTKPKCIFNKT